MSTQEELISSIAALRVEIVTLDQHLREVEKDKKLYTQFYHSLLKSEFEHMNNVLHMKCSRLGYLIATEKK